MDSSTPIDLGKQIKIARGAKGMTIGDFADRLKVSKTTALNWESGTNTPRPAKLKEIERVLNVSLDVTGSSQKKFSIGGLDEEITDLLRPISRLPAEMRATLTELIRQIEKSITETNKSSSQNVKLSFDAKYLQQDKTANLPPSSHEGLRTSLALEIEQLHQLKVDGILSDQEFVAAKKKLITV